MSKLKWILSRIRRTLWVRVSLYAVAGVVAALAASLSNRFLDGQAPLDISAEAIDSLLSIIASSMLAVTTFSVGALTSAYAGATSNATPRATPLLTQDRVVQGALATFVGSFLFSIVGLIALKVSVYGAEGRAVLFLFTLGVIVLIVVALLRWISHLTRLGRVGDTIGRLEAATRESMQARIALPYLGGQLLRRAPDAHLPGSEGPVEGAAEGAVTEGAVIADAVGYVQFIDTKALSAIADTLQSDIQIHVLPGTFVYHGSVLAHLPVIGAALPQARLAALRDAFTIGEARTYDQDPRFGLVVLSEVALRALSPAVNDPGTAIDVIGRQVRLLSHWGDAWDAAERGAQGGAQSDAQSDAGQAAYPRIHVAALAYDDLYEDAFNLIARDGAGQVDVMLRLVKALQALARTGPEPARRAARRQLRIALARAQQALGNSDDRRRLDAALTLDPADLGD